MKSIQTKLSGSIMHLKIAVSVITLVLATTATDNAQAATPTMTISKENATQIRLQWDSEAGGSYQVLATEEIDPFALWLPAIGPVPATGTSTFVLTDSSEATTFYRLHVLGQLASGLPTVRIVSHAGGETVYGLITIVVAAQDDSRLSSVSLLIDGEEQDVVLTEGSLEWIVNTGHFSNGPHTIVARAQDNSGAGYIGGNPNANVAGNETYSAPVTLNFANVSAVTQTDPPAVEMQGFKLTHPERGARGLPAERRTVRIGGQYGQPTHGANTRRNPNADEARVENPPNCQGIGH